MNISLELYRTFYVVAKHKHMTKASEELFTSQSAVSQSIKKLETLLGGSLFTRSNKGMELTEEGKMLFAYVQGSLELIRNAENNFTHYKNLGIGEIKIGIPTTLTKLILLDTLQKFHADYPNIKIVIVNELTKNLILDLQKGKLDFVIFNETKIKETNVTVRELGKLKQSFIYNPKYFSFSDKQVNLSELSELPLILQSNSSNSRQHLDFFLSQHGVVLTPNMEVVSQELLIEFVNIGLGVGFAIEELAAKNCPHLKTIKLNREVPSIPVSIAINKSLTLPFASKKFLEYLKMRQA